jgi:hypothetical protein
MLNATFCYINAECRYAECQGTLLFALIKHIMVYCLVNF